MVALLVRTARKCAVLVFLFLFYSSHPSNLYSTCVMGRRRFRFVAYEGVGQPHCGLPELWERTWFPSPRKRMLFFYRQPTVGLLRSELELRQSTEGAITLDFLQAILLACLVLLLALAGLALGGLGRWLGLLGLGGRGRRDDGLGLLSPLLDRRRPTLGEDRTGLHLPTTTLTVNDRPGGGYGTVHITQLLGGVQQGEVELLGPHLGGADLDHVRVNDRRVLVHVLHLGHREHDRVFVDVLGFRHHRALEQVEVQVVGRPSDELTALARANALEHQACLALDDGAVGGVFAVDAVQVHGGVPVADLQVGIHHTLDLVHGLDSHVLGDTEDRNRQVLHDHGLDEPALRRHLALVVSDPVGTRGVQCLVLAIIEVLVQLGGDVGFHGVSLG